MHSSFKNKPFPLHVSPLMVRDKPNSNKKHIIMDLSWQKGLSVNNQYLFTYFNLRYPSVDHITQAVCKLGPETLIYKVDISRAFHHLRINPGDIDLLGISHNGYLVDGSLPFVSDTVLYSFSGVQMPFISS